MQKVLDKFGITEENFLGAGVECATYDIGLNKVIKVYHNENNTSYENFKALQSFYDSLDTTEVTFNTPKIHSIETENGQLVVTEEKLNGFNPNNSYISALNKQQLHKFIDNYFNMIISLRKVKITGKENKERFLLQNNVAWKNLLIKTLKNEYSKNKGLLNVSKINNSNYKYLLSYFEQLDTVTIGVTHGDLNLNNIFIDENLNIISLFDFNGFNSKFQEVFCGDINFDLSIAWLSIDQQFSKDLSDYFLKKIFNFLNIHERKSFVAYILFYSFTKANIFNDSGEKNGFFSWCKSHINKQEWWEIINSQ